LAQQDLQVLKVQLEQLVLQELQVLKVQRVMMGQLELLDHKGLLD
jgi:hypothetical protein